MAKPVRLLAASCAACATDVATLLVLVHGLHLGRGVATLLACVAGGAVNFALCRAWLGSAQQPAAVQAARYGVLVVFGGGVWQGVLAHAVTARFAWPLLAVKAMSATLVTLGWNWPIATRVVFRAPTP